LHDDERPSAESAAGAATATFVFADIAGYTALTERTVMNKPRTS
jgi:class 3 adenylate cyclase